MILSFHHSGPRNPLQVVRLSKYLCLLSHLTSLRQNFMRGVFGVGFPIPGAGVQQTMLYRKEDRFVWCVQVCVDSRLSEVFVLLGDLALQQN